MLIGAKRSLENLGLMVAVWVLVGCSQTAPKPDLAETDVVLTLGGVHFTLPGSGGDSAGGWVTEESGGTATCKNSQLGLVFELARGQLKANDQVVGRVETGDAITLFRDGRLLHNGLQAATLPALSDGAAPGK